MRRSSFGRRLRRALCVLGLLFACLFLAQRDSGEVFAIGTFTPASSAALCNQFTGPVSPSDPICSDAPGSLATNNPSDVTTRLAIGMTDYNYSLLVTTTPGTGFTAAGPGNPAFMPGTHPALGDLAGQLASHLSVSSSGGNGACDFGSALMSMKLINATVDNSAGNSLNPIPIGQTAAAGQGTLENMLSDTGMASTAPVYTPPVGIPSNGLPADIDRYPSFLNAMFDPDFTSYGPNGVPFDGDDVNGPTPPLQPLARYAGHQVVIGTAATLNLVVFAPGVLATAFPAPHPYHDLTSDMGYTTIAVFRDPTQPPAPSPLDHNCTDLVSLTTFWGEARNNACNGLTAPPCNTAGGIDDPGVGANNGLDRSRTPMSAGAYLYVTYTTSQRDADGDGYENALDTCPLAANSDNPKTTPGSDSDGIDPACDPTPTVDTSAGNHDGDTAANGSALINVLDNCPLVANGSQADSERDHSYYEPFATNPAPQGGPKPDDIGDACDPNPGVVDGKYHADLDMTAKCIGGTDADADGWCTSIGMGVAASDPNDGNAAITPEDFDLVFPMGVAMAGAGDNPAVGFRETGAQCANGTDDDGDLYVNDGCPHVGSGGVFATEYGVQCTNAINDDSSDDSLVNDGCPAVTERNPVQVCNDGLDNDGDTLVDNMDLVAGNSSCKPTALIAHPGYPVCPVLGCAQDSDGDGSTDEAERHMGTNPLGRCEPGSPGGNPSTSNDWPPDLAAGAFGSVDKVNITDLTTFIAPILIMHAKPSEPEFFSRWDLVPGSSGGNWIDITDLTALIASNIGYPPMNSGQRVFGSTFVCTGHPTFGR